MDKQKAIKLAGGVRALAELLGLTTQAIYAWKTMPRLHVYVLREKRPAWFKTRVPRPRVRAMGAPGR